MTNLTLKKINNIQYSESLCVCAWSVGVKLQCKNDSSLLDENSCVQYLIKSSKIKMIKCGQ